MSSSIMTPSDMILTPGEYVAELSFSRACDPEILRRALTAMGWQNIIFDDTPSPSTGVGFGRPATSTTPPAARRGAKAAPRAEPPICVAARSAIARGSQAAPNLVAQCRALGISIDYTPPPAQDGTYIDESGHIRTAAPKAMALGRVKMPAAKTVSWSTVQKPTDFTAKVAPEGKAGVIAAALKKPKAPVKVPGTAPGEAAPSAEEKASLNAAVIEAMDIPKTYGVGDACVVPKADADGSFNPKEAQAFIDCINAAVDAYNAAPAAGTPPPPAAPPTRAETPAAPAAPGGGGGGGGGEAPAPEAAYPQAEPEAPSPEPAASEWGPPQAAVPVTAPAEIPQAEDPLVVLTKRLQSLSPGEAPPIEPLPNETAEIKSLRIQNLWRRWNEWGSPFSTSPQGTIDTMAMANVQISGTGDEETRIRFIGRLASTIRLVNSPGMRWLMVKRLSVEYDGDIRIHVEPHRLDPGHFYEFRILSRDKSAPDRDTVKHRLGEMGWAPMKLSLIKRNIRLPNRPSSLSMWYGMGQWLAPSTVVTVEDPFYFEQVHEATP